MKKSLVVGLIILLLAGVVASSIAAYKQTRIISDVTTKSNAEIERLNGLLKRYEFVNDEDLYNLCKSRAHDIDQERWAQRSTPSKREDGRSVQSVDAGTYMELKKLHEDDLAQCEQFQ